MAVEPPSPATKLLVIGTICAAIFYADNISTWLRGWDGWIFWLVILLFLVVSRIGTKIVIRIAADGGELPANDEMFNFPDLNERPPSPPPSPPGITTARARLDAALAGTPATARPPPPPSTPPRHTPSAAQDGGPIFRPGAWRTPAAILAIVGVFVLSSGSTNLRPARLDMRPAAVSNHAPTPAEPLSLARVRTAEDRAATAEREAARLREKLDALLLSTTLTSPPPPPSPAAASSSTAADVSETCNEALRAQLASRSLSSRRLNGICKTLAPAVAVRPAPLPALSSSLAVELSPWKWASSPARLHFDPDGINGALTTPWGEGRWGSLPRHPAVLWASFADRDHLLWMRGTTLVSHRCKDNETVIVEPAEAGKEAAAFAAVGTAAGNSAACARAVRLSPWTLWAAASSGGRLNRGFALSLSNSGAASLGRSSPISTTASAATAPSCASLRWQCQKSGALESLSLSSPSDASVNVTLILRGDELLLLNRTADGVGAPCWSRREACAARLGLLTPRSGKIAFLGLSSSRRSPQPQPADDDEDEDDEDDDE